MKLEGSLEMVNSPILNLLLSPLKWLQPRVCITSTLSMYHTNLQDPNHKNTSFPPSNQPTPRTAFILDNPSLCPSPKWKKKKQELTRTVTSSFHLSLQQRTTQAFRNLKLPSHQIHLTHWPAGKKGKPGMTLTHDTRKLFHRLSPIKNTPSHLAASSRG